MKKSLLYTRTGDSGTTALVGGSRVEKYCDRVCAYGAVDELNAHLGLLQAWVAQVDGAADDAAMLTRIQGLMFCIGACLATPLGADGSPAVPQVSDDDLTDLEHAIDRLDASVAPQRTFLLPGGTVPSGQAQVARAVCRRAEREVLRLHASGQLVHPMVSRYLNRLSDYLFILARRLNHLAGVSDIPWP
ncbi:MAG: cob(I)yrinic acid a,c-diamide adenosyltransferase [Duncaniella sp.]|nr:cob(I)yrinic acid a,c-diamide adenosyltransferase [Duncaniella sp.]